MNDVLKLAEKFEIEGFRFYNQKQKEVKNKVVAEIFADLAQMEKEHTEFIRNLIKKIEEGLEIDLPSDATQIFQKQYDYQMKEATQENDLLDLAMLRTAYLIEKDFMEFYDRAAKSEKNGKVKKIIELLRDWEEGHKKIIEKQIEIILERNNLDLGFYPF